MWFSKRGGGFPGSLARLSADTEWKRWANESVQEELVGRAAALRSETNLDKAAQALKLTAGDLAELNVIDEVLPEPLGGAHEDADAVAVTLRDALLRHLCPLSALQPERLVALRRQKYEQLGEWREPPDVRASTA